MSDTETIASTMPRERENQPREASSISGLRPITDLANAAFALQQRGLVPGTGAALEQLRPLQRHIVRIMECLHEIGLEIHNHTDQPFDSAMSLEVIGFQPTPGLSEEVVLDTIRPTVYLRGLRIQIGQVIVATPEQVAEKGARSEPAYN